MSDTGEVIGSVAEGALLARAAEPGHGQAGDDGHTHERACLNCATPLLGSHCHQCGQAAHVHKTLGAFFHDLLHGVFHFEGKIWRTVPLLVWNPGRLTREYIDGRRASYVSPIALFLFCIFLMFAVVKQFAGAFDPGSLVKVNNQVVNEGLPAQTKRLAELQREREALVKAGKPVDAIDGQIAGTQEAIRVMEEVKNAKFENINARSDLTAIDHTLREIKTNPGLALYKLQSNAYKFSWALIPISVPFVWLLFAWRRRFGIYDHTVFVTYSLCFMSLLVVALTLAFAAGAPALLPVAVLAVPLHMYRQLRGGYELRRFSAIWRTVVLLFVGMIALILFAMLILAQSGS